MTFELTHDYALVSQIAKHPKLWPRLADDFTDKDTWKPVQHEAFHYVLVKDEGEVLGFFLLVPMSPVLWEIHTALLPNAWGDRSKIAVQGVFDWLWATTPAQRLFTQVPDSNRLAIAAAERAGMKHYGVQPNAYMKNGELESLILLGINRPERSNECQ